MPHTPRKRFGQNFLKDASIIEKILFNVDIKKHDSFLEIGPGLGALTKQVIPKLDKNSKLYAVEIDKELSSYLSKIYIKDARIIIICNDILKLESKDIFQNESIQKIRVIGNLPYNISTQLIFHFLSNKFMKKDGTPIISDMHFMLQKEVVDRMTAIPDSKSYGRLSIMTQYHCEVKDLFSVPPAAFTPKPKVMSKIVRLKPFLNKSLSKHDEKLFSVLVKKAFEQRRKTLKNSLKDFFSKDDLEKIKINPDLRPESLTVNDFKNLAKNFKLSKSI